MSAVELRPATAEDFELYTTALYGAPRAVPLRLRGFTATIGGRILGIGGIAFWPDGTRSAFCDLTDDARSYPVALHKAAKKTIALARGLGVKRLVATAYERAPAASRWLARLGFRPLLVGGILVYVLDL